MKIKSLFTFALAATMLFSCSKEENDGPGINPEEGVETFVKVSLNRLANNTKAHYGDLNVTDEEKAIHSVTLYVFNSVGVLEAEVSFDASDSKTFKATTGKKTFLAAVNIPDSELPDVTPGTTTLASIKSEQSVTTIDDMNLIANIQTPASDSKFWMTTLNDDNTFVLEEAEESETTGSSPKNNVEIKVGRAMAKVGVYFDEATVQPADGKLQNLEYKIMNNPKKMQIFPSKDVNGYLVTPYYNATTIVPGNYFGNSAYLGTGLTSGKHASPSYMMENSNLEPKGGNATYVMLKGVFTPTTTYDADGANPQPGVAGANFWRVNDGTGYTSKYYREGPSTAEIDGGEAYPYNNGVCYYSLPLTDITKGNVDRYTIRRNTYWSVSIVSVNGAGENDEDGATPDPGEDLEADTYMKAIITVEQWEDVEQGGGI